MSKKPIISSIIENLVFKVGDLLLGFSLVKVLKKQRSLNRLTEEELQELQEKKLAELIQHATSSCEIYRSHGLNESCPLNEFPVINKSAVQKNLDKFISSKYEKEKLIRYETSGSSGVRAKVYVDKVEQSIFRAILINWWEWTGFYLGKPILQTGITPKRGWLKTLKDHLTNTVYCNAFAMDEEEAVSKLKKISAYKTRHLGGFASSLYVLASYAEKNNLNITFDAAIAWGDKLFDHYKKKIENVFHTKVYENYACNEGIMIGQKVDLDYFYIYTPNVFLELLDEKDCPVPDGDVGRVVVTKLDGYAMPLIRYDTGDLAIKLPIKDYPKNRRFNFPLLKMVIGRNTDIVKTPEGKNLIVHTFTGIFEFYKEIKQFRIVQNKIDSIVIEYIPSEYFKSSSLSIIEADIREKTGTNMGIKWSKVELIQSTASGKPQLIVNNLVTDSLTSIS